MKKIRVFPAGAPGICIMSGEKVFRGRSNFSKLNTLIRCDLFDKRSDRGTADKVLSDLCQSVLCSFKLGTCFSGAQLGSVIKISRIPGIKTTSWAGSNRVGITKKYTVLPQTARFHTRIFLYLPVLVAL